MRSTVGLALALPLGLNIPGLIALAGRLFKPLGVLTLVVLPFVALWILSSFRGTYPSALHVTEFGMSTEAPLGWMVMFGFWVVVGCALSVLYAAVRARISARGKP